MSLQPLTTTTRPPGALSVPRGDFTRPRILIVDDEPEMIQLIEEVLELMPSEILVEHDGESALRLLQREITGERTVDIVLLDIMMPGEDGFHTLSRIKADPRSTADSRDPYHRAELHCGQNAGSADGSR